MNIITGGHGYGRTEFLIQWIQGFMQQVKCLVFTESKANECEFVARLGKHPGVKVVNIYGKSWQDVAKHGKHGTQNFDIVMFDTDLKYYGNEFATVVHELTLYNNPVVITTVEDGRQLSMYVAPGLSPEIINKAQFDVIEPFIVTKVNGSMCATTVPPFPLQHGQTLFVSSSGHNRAFNPDFDSDICGTARNIVLDDLGDDATVTLGCHTMTKKELADMIDWWKR